MPLKRKQVCYLRGLAHKLNPLVQMGKGGYTNALVEEVSRNLSDHELVKVRLGAEDRSEFDGLAADLAEQTRATLVQTIGRIAVLYREGEKPEIRLP